MNTGFPRRILTRAAALLAALLLILAFPSCGKDKEESAHKGETPIGLIVVYNGPEVTDTRHVFSPDEFSVLASYEDGTDEYIHDYEFEQVGLDRGFYILRVAYNGYETEAYVRCNVAIYPSQLNP